MSNEDADTEPFDVLSEDSIDLCPIDLPVKPGKHHIPEPALVRAGLFAVANLVAAIVGKQVLTPDVLEQLMILYGIVGPVVLGWWIRRHVTPVAK